MTFCPNFVTVRNRYLYYFIYFYNFILKMCKLSFFYIFLYPLIPAFRHCTCRDPVSFLCLDERYFECRNVRKERA